MGPVRRLVRLHEEPFRPPGGSNRIAAAGQFQPILAGGVAAVPSGGFFRSAEAGLPSFHQIRGDAV
jgi:hypothetical protein